MSHTEPVFQLVPKLRVYLKKAQFFPGECVRGRIRLNVGYPIKACSLDVNLEGTQTASSKSVDILKQTKTIWGSEDKIKEQKMMSSGLYSWDFEFVLPQKMAPSHLDKYSSTEWAIR